MWDPHNCCFFGPPVEMLLVLACVWRGGDGGGGGGGGGGPHLGRERFRLFQRHALFRHLPSSLAVHHVSVLGRRRTTSGVLARMERLIAMATVRA